MLSQDVPAGKLAGDGSRAKSWHQTTAELAATFLAFHYRTMFRFAKPDFETDGRGWPHREWSTFYDVSGLRWHVQRHGTGPVCLLLHGTAASTHSWRGLAPLLAERMTVIAPDLPGHGFTGTPDGARLTLTTMARLVTALLGKLRVEPDLVVGHSAGAAIALRMALDGSVAPAGIVSLNGALRPFRGAAGPLSSVIAKALFLNPLAPRIFARGANQRRVARLLENIGSPLDAPGIDFYQRLFQNSGHVAGALAMMANWDLSSLQRDLPRLRQPLLLVTSDGDRAVPPADAAEVMRLTQRAKLARVARLGHLAHEEDPAAITALVNAFAEELAILPPRGAEGAPEAADRAEADCEALGPPV